MSPGAQQKETVMPCAAGMALFLLTFTWVIVCIFEILQKHINASPRQTVYSIQSVFFVVSSMLNFKP
jgi:hypothetical protein